MAAQDPDLRFAMLTLQAAKSVALNRLVTFSAGATISVAAHFWCPWDYLQMYDAVGRLSWRLLPRLLLAVLIICFHGDLQVRDKE